MASIISKSYKISDNCFGSTWLDLTARFNQYQKLLILNRCLNPRPAHFFTIMYISVSYSFYATFRSAERCLFLQLRIEQRRGRVFQGWNEGKIYFPPTYKYLTNSDRYTGDNLQHKEKRRTPAWYIFLKYKIFTHYITKNVFGRNNFC